ncbi:response regulator [Halobacterium wangiae]|uniref:response regulator n=1 Tax=Halobacterium wangiae TaxID=2902623 RepID=UPI001E659113|nr:response regulator [Halobacterium wangiae]
MTPDEERVGDHIDILLVEPNPGDARLFAESFNDGKLLNEIYTVTDGEAAIDFVQQHGAYAEMPRPDLVLLEPRLPGKAGMELLSELKDESALSDVPIVVLSSSDVGEDIARSHGLDADYYIQKPVEPEEFIQFVQSVEEFWLAVVRHPGED